MARARENGRLIAENTKKNGLTISKGGNDSALAKSLFKLSINKGEKTLHRYSQSLFDNAPYKNVLQKIGHSYLTQR